MTDHLATTFIRHGLPEELPERRALRAGPVTCVLEGADLRYVRFGSVEVVNRLYMAVRDRNWNTIPPTFTSFEIESADDAFRVTFTAEHVAGEVDFAWRGTITGSTDGTVRYAMDGAPRRPFHRNRIGLCVLHPMSLAGVPATVETPDGTVEAAFPDLISPHQPFLDMVAISHPAGPDGRATLAFEGDLFETEDQRNWTDASYKTYSTPLRLPYPVEVTPDDRIAQAVTVSVAGRPSLAASGGERADVVVDPASRMPLPSIGLGAGGTRLTDPNEIASLRAVAPGHLWVELDLGGDDWRDRLATAAANADALGAPLDLSVVAGPGETGWDALAEALAEGGVEVGRVFAFPPVAEPVTFPRGDMTTHRESVTSAKAALAGRGITVGGGARAYFTELNRASDTGALPVDEIDTVAYTVNPTVHAVDTLSLIETLAAQAETVRSARAIVGDRPLVVGPVTFRPPFNPNATASPPPPGPDELPPSVDTRQLSLIGAGWTVGSIARLAAAGADALTYYELIGWRGLVERREGLTRRELFPSIPGGLFPLYHVFAAVASFRAAGPAQVEVASVTLADGLATECLALVADGRAHLLVSNLTDEHRTVRIEMAGITAATVRTLDETTYHQAAEDLTFFTVDGGEPVETGGGTVQLTIAPFAVARLDVIT